MSKLVFSQVDFSYGEQRILQDFHLTIRQGEFVSIIGPSGVGKSTLFQLASGLLEPTGGTISLDGDAVKPRLGRVGYMPQKDLLMPWRTVAENAALPLEIQGVPKKAALARVREELPRFGLAAYADATIDKLSGGMRQRVSLLRAILTGADLLLLDEPFSALDGITRMEMQEWLLDLWQKLGKTVILITHDLDEAALLADRVLVLQRMPIQQPVEIPVPFPHPRSAALRYEPSFTVIREQMWKLLKEREQGTAVLYGVSDQQPAGWKAGGTA
ncbi:ABC transporter ATP-binding protein [Brevibacillus dissolubilis]|uniref:ABC transporter ATP-binding protein n=1 Tax=Brevibacillus dissolubilis TaxID=1844116 RepID=UPI0011172FDF|nr:ABC transporter ATP-binding protein [Brevibacillus dissolubilis]